MISSLFMCVLASCDMGENDKYWDEDESSNDSDDVIDDDKNNSGAYENEDTNTNESEDDATIKLDPFNGISFTTNGISPYCQITVNTQNCDADVQRYVEYSFDKDNYANGETAVVTAALSYYADTSVYCLSSSVYNYQISGQPEYITSLDGVDVTVIERELEDYVDAGTAKAVSGVHGSYLFSLYEGYSGGTNFKSCDEIVLETIYFSVLKNTRYSDFKLAKTPFNKISFVYKIEYTWENKNLRTSGTKTAWFNIEAQNIIQYPDGTVKWGSASSSGFDFVCAHSLEGEEDCISSTIMVDKTNYNISKES